MTKQRNRDSKPCMCCGRPFAWRRKWSRCWHEVKFCSERCRREFTSKKSNEVQQEKSQS
ncbi:DUF2256 domain-containing protein [Rubripirellula amarantea]|uniref:DUF2256 domain-containing protein n=1 Tax=Rubripirellula amarantea TaxID=2527999 RepID=UPI0011B4F4FE